MESSSSSSTSTPAPIRMLIINPNTSTTMTTALSPMLTSLSLPGVEFSYFTCPSPGIASINSPSDAARSAELSLPHLLALLPQHDCFLVACYSVHPLVGMLKAECAKLSGAGTSTKKYVTGIFEASVTTSLAIIDPLTQCFGIVSTGQVWEKALAEGVWDFVGLSSGGVVNAEAEAEALEPARTQTSVFRSCETTGLNASELHDLPAAQVRQKMMEATARLVVGGGGESRGGRTTDSTRKREVAAICLGCAGMVGLDSAVREACVNELGEEKGNMVHIVDGVKAGVAILYALAKGGF